MNTIEQLLLSAVPPVLIAAWTLAAVSCREVPSVSRIPIEFGLGPETKGAPQLVSLERLAAQDFSVSAWYTPEGGVFGTGSARYVTNHRFGTMDEINYAVWQGITRSGGKAADPVYYPLDGTLSYFCYAPYREDVGGHSDIHVEDAPESAVTARLPHYLAGSPLICFTPRPVPGDQIDFIAAAPLIDIDRSSDAVPLDFTGHLTASVQFWFRYSGTLDPTEGVMVSRIVLRDVIGSEYLYFKEEDGVFSPAWCSTVSPEDGGPEMPLSSYTLSAEASDLIIDSPYLDPSAFKYVNNTINGRLYLLPQTLPAEASLDITYVIKDKDSNVRLEENTVSVPLAGTADWQQGKVVKYSIVIAVADRKDVSVSVALTDWEEAGNSHPGQELMY
ncbi:MAG: fimbrillin family protein [Bacteroidales bacterium]|nr:fimbrillin family protein [Bacteroidales bacterium]